MHVHSNIETRSPNHCCRGKTASITYSECVSVALGTQQVTRMRLVIVICGLSGSTIQGIYKRMVRFQKVTRNLFLILHGHNVHRQQRKLSKFLMRYQQFASHA